MLGTQNSMAKSTRFLLADIVNADIRNFANQLQLLGFAAGLQVQLQLDAAVEMVFNGTLAAAGNNQDILNAGSKSLFDNILDGRFINDRQHLLRSCFGSRQKACAQACCRNNGFTYRFKHLILSPLQTQMKYMHSSNAAGSALRKNTDTQES